MVISKAKSEFSRSEIHREAPAKALNLKDHIEILV